MHISDKRAAAHRRDHLLLTPDTFVRAPLPGMRNATAIVHAAPAVGAGFTAVYGRSSNRAALSSPAPAQTFLYVLDGVVTVARMEEHRLSPGQYAYLPPDRAARIGRQTQGAGRGHREVRIGNSTGCVAGAFHRRRAHGGSQAAARRCSDLKCARCFPMTRRSISP